MTDRRAGVTVYRRMADVNPTGDERPKNDPARSFHIFAFPPAEIC
jgi:hypothetical protein